MSKRVVNRKGDIYCVNISNQYKVYFQYVADDMTQLNSSVIRVFKTRHQSESSPTIEEIINDSIDFYAHTMINIGLKQGLWSKIGSSKDMGNIDNIGFKMLDSPKDTSWYVWTINSPIEYHANLPSQYSHYDWGWVYASINIVKRIKDGCYYVIEEERKVDRR